MRVPAALVRLGYHQEEVQRQVREWLVLSLFTEGRISSGKAARWLSISRVDFLALLRKRGQRCHTTRRGDITTCGWCITARSVR